MNGVDLRLQLFIKVIQKYDTMEYNLKNIPIFRKRYSENRISKAKSKNKLLKLPKIDEILNTKLKSYNKSRSQIISKKFDAYDKDFVEKKINKSINCDVFMPYYKYCKICHKRNIAYQLLLNGKNERNEIMKIDWSKWITKTEFQ